MTAPTQRRSGPPSPEAKARAHARLDAVRKELESNGSFVAMRAQDALPPAERGIYVGAGALLQLPRASSSAATRNAAPPPSNVTAQSERAELERLRRAHVARTERAELERLRREQLAGLSDVERAQAAKLTDPAQRARFVARCRSRKEQSRGAR